MSECWKARRHLRFGLQNGFACCTFASAGWKAGQDRYDASRVHAVQPLVPTLRVNVYVATLPAIVGSPTIAVLRSGYWLL